MKHAIAIAAAAAAFFGVYLLAGFIAWDLNPATWDIGGRLYVGVIGAMCAAIAASIAEGAA